MYLAQDRRHNKYWNTYWTGETCLDADTKDAITTDKLVALKKILATSSPARIENELHILESLRCVQTHVDQSIIDGDDQRVPECLAVDHRVPGGRPGHHRAPLSPLGRFPRESASHSDLQLAADNDASTSTGIWTPRTSACTCGPSSARSKTSTSEGSFIVT